ncbi:MAG: hypothetical protein U0487_01510 [Patescibacteria group bacterium]
MANLEQLAVAICRDRIKLTSAHHPRDAELPFVARLCYGERPRFNEYDGTIRCDSLQAVVTKRHRQHDIRLHIAFLPELVIDINGLQELNLSRSLANLHMSEGDALLYMILGNFVQKAHFHFLLKSSGLIVYVRYDGQVSLRSSLAPLQSGYLLNL